MRRKRLTGIRLTRIAAWTTLATGWVAALLGRVGSTPAALPDDLPAPAGVVESVEYQPALPRMPESGLMVIRSDPSPAAAEPEVRRVVVQRVVERPVVQSRGS